MTNTVSVSDRVSIAVISTRTTGTVIQHFIGVASHTVSEVQSVIIMTGSLAAPDVGLHLTDKRKSAVPSKRDPKFHPHSETLPPARPHLLIVLHPLGPISFKTLQ